MYTHTPHAKVVFVAPSLSQIAANRFLKMTMTNDFAKGLILLALKTIKILGGGGGGGLMGIFACSWEPVAGV